MNSFLRRYKLSNLHIAKCIFLIILPISVAAGLYYHFQYETYDHALLLGLIVMYLLNIFAISAGYHRLFAHRAFKATKAVKAFLLFVGASTLENSVLEWSSEHRTHHKYEDTDKDPYNIKEGFFYAHIGWIMLKSRKENQLAKDLLNDSMVAFQHKYYYPIMLFSNFIPFIILYYTTGSLIGSLTFGVLLRLFIVHHVTYCINSYCHTFGSQPYSDKNTAKDSGIISLLTFGESYHNFHHTFQLDFRNGYRWFNLDMTKWIVFTWEKIGLVSDLKRASDVQVLAARMAMKAKKRASYYDEFSEELKLRLEELRKTTIQKKKYLINLKKEYKRIAKNKIDEASSIQLKQLKAEIRKMKSNFQYSYNEWKNYLKYAPTAFA